MILWVALLYSEKYIFKVELRSKLVVLLLYLLAMHGCDDDDYGGPEKVFIHVLKSSMLVLRHFYIFLSICLITYEIRHKLLCF